MAYRTLDDLCKSKLAGKGAVVLVRADLNVPLDDDGAVRDATRIKRLIPTLKKLTNHKFCVGILSHFGRPDGELVEEMSLLPIAKELDSRLDGKVSFINDCIGESVKNTFDELPEGEICVLENTRFYEEEERNSSEFAKEMVDATGAVAYVNDAFSAAHRAHASTEAIAHILPAYCGISMLEELDALSNISKTEKGSLVAVVGGAKISTKLPILENLSKEVGKLIIGGAMANTFLAAQGYNVGTSLYEESMIDIANNIINSNYCEIILPVDVVVAEKLKLHAPHETVLINEVPNDKMILDVGEESIIKINKIFDTAKTLIWNGPLGAFETPPFNLATYRCAGHAADLSILQNVNVVSDEPLPASRENLFSIGGGGDTVAALAAAGAAGDFTYISTAGGAFLEYLAGTKLPALEALEK